MISLFAREKRDAKRQSLNDLLALLARHIDFAAIAAEVDAKLNLGRSGRGGRPPYPTVVMVKLLLLQQLYNLSDDALEYQVLDRTSFLRFVGLEHSRRVPDAKTLWVWRERLKRQNLIGDISAAVSDQLHRAGFIARGGQIIDASIVNAPIQRNTREENEAVKQGQVPEDWSAAKRAQKDVEARWTKKHGKSNDPCRQCVCQWRPRSRTQAARLSCRHPAQGSGRQAAQCGAAAPQPSHRQGSRVR